MKITLILSVAFWLVLLVLNPNLWAADASALHPYTFYLPAVEAGEWWRCLTFIFAHFSWYHLISDAVVTYWLLLRLPGRLALTAFVVAWAGSLFVPLITSDSLSTMNLGGLSGVVHGLPIALVWPYLRAKQVWRRFGVWSLIVLLLGKGCFETITSTGVIATWHLWELNCVPSGAAHLGGTLAVLLFCFARGTISFPRISTRLDTQRPFAI